MYFYLTTNEFYSGIYQGQVIDLVDFLKEELNYNVRLIAFLPLKGFWQRRKEIRRHAPSAIVLPMTPRQSSGLKWRQNQYLLGFICKLYGCKGIICRGPFAVNLASFAKNKNGKPGICYDGRGAVAAEAEEYNVFPLPIKNEIRSIERDALTLSDTRICITESLLRYWRNEYNYTGDNHYIIPGTLNKNFLVSSIDRSTKNAQREKLGYGPEDILLIYSGSTEGWQSFNLLYEFLSAQFRKNRFIKVLFLSKEEENIKKLKQEFPGCVNRLWLSPSDVRDVLSAADYGLIIRENTITNRVAMPTKFPEYLACGLNVLANSSVDLVTSFIEKHECGLLIDKHSDIVLHGTSGADNLKNRELAIKYFNKFDPAFRSQYVSLMNKLRYGSINPDMNEDHK
ncbi:MAG: glycosyltransferase [Bacteroidota bacterium]|jgi:hypothetical protein|nr:glycosyltransferase [Bacteroidota bacterium]